MIEEMCERTDCRKASIIQKCGRSWQSPAMPRALHTAGFATSHSMIKPVLVRYLNLDPKDGIEEPHDNLSGSIAMGIVLVLACNK